MRTIIAGGRGLKVDRTFWPQIDGHHELYPITEVVCGCADGGDEIGRQWAIAHKIPVKEFPADWKKYGRAAGFRRNAEMGDYAGRAGALIALPGGRGTNMMLNIAHRKGLLVRLVSDVAKDSILLPRW